MPGRTKSTVHALTDELDLWLLEGVASAAAHQGETSQHPPSPTLPLNKTKRPPTHVMFASAVAFLAIATAGLSVVRLSHEESPAALQAFNAGEYAWQKRTPEGLRRAVDAFTQSIVAEPSFARAYVGLADCYNLLPEFGSMRPVDAFPRAKAAAERAVALEPNSASAHRSLAFALFWWGDDQARAMAEFRTALRLDPSSAQSHHWYANALAAELDPGAQREIARAVELDPASTAIKADAGWIAYMLGRSAEAITILDEVIDLDPGYSTGFRYRASAKREGGDYSGMLEDLRREAEARNDRAFNTAVGEAETALRSKGAPAMFKSLAASEEVLFNHGDFPASRLASDEFLAGDRQRALQLLAITKQRREWFASAINNPSFGTSRKDLEFRRLRELGQNSHWLETAEY